MIGIVKTVYLKVFLWQQRRQTELKSFRFEGVSGRGEWPGMAFGTRNTVVVRFFLRDQLSLSWPITCIYFFFFRLTFVFPSFFLMTSVSYLLNTGQIPVLSIVAVTQPSNVHGKISTDIPTSELQPIELGLKKSRCPDAH